MDYIINGKCALSGELPVYGAKNCALALLGGSVLTEDDVVLENFPQIADVENMMEILRAMGKKVAREGEIVTVGGSLTTTEIPHDLAKLLRGSGLILGGALAKCGSAFLPSTGGCAIGRRPIDIHLDGLRAMGVEVLESPMGVQCRGKPQSCRFCLRFASVGATENLLCAAALAEGEVVLFNCALEPEVVALEQLLSAMGAKIDGVGTSVVTVHGVTKLHGAAFRVIPDRIVAATYLACAAAAGGKISVTHCYPQHMQAFLKVLGAAFELKEFPDAVTISARFAPRTYGNLSTQPYPGFPTDVQQVMMSLCACSNGGVSTLSEKLFENRLKHNACQLAKMGAEISVDGDTAVITGRRLRGAEVAAGDLRGGAGLVVAALAAEGQTKVSNAQHVLRGYSNLCESLSSVGADIVLR